MTDRYLRIPVIRRVISNDRITPFLDIACRVPSVRFEPLGCVDSWDSLLGANQIQGCFWEAVLGVMDRLVLERTRRGSGWLR